MSFLPEAKLATDNAGGDVVKAVIADAAPDSIIVDF